MPCPKHLRGDRVFCDLVHDVPAWRWYAQDELTGFTCRGESSTRQKATQALEWAVSFLRSMDDLK